MSATKSISFWALMVTIGFLLLLSGALPLRGHEVEVAALIGLENRLIEQVRVAALSPVRRLLWRQQPPPPHQLGVIDQQADAPIGDVELDLIAGAHQRQRATG